MPWNILVPEQVPYVEVTISGELSGADVFLSYDACISAAQIAGRKLLLADLADFRGGPSIVDLMDMAAERQKEPNRTILRTAMILPVLERPAKLVQYSETVFVNRGLTAKAFSDRSDAKAWLISEASALGIAQVR